MSSQQIFFSYSRADSAFALTLAKDLREVGADIWIDQLDIPAGSHWDAAVEKALNNAAYVLVILTPSSTASTNVMDEVSFALESGKKIVPVMQEDCLPPFRLRRLQRIDFTIDYNTGFHQLTISLNLSPENVAKSKGLDFQNSQIDAAASDTPEAPTGNDQRDNAHWEEACKLNTIASYRRYLNLSLTGSFVEEARLMIRQLELEQKEDEIEALLWQKTKSGNTKLLYQHYLETYPHGTYKTLAVGAIAEFEKLETAAKDKQLLLEKEKAQKEQEERDRQLQIEKEKAQKEKIEREKQTQIEKEKAQKEKIEREKQTQIEKAKAQKEKEEKEKQIALANAKAKAERDKQLQLEKEKAQQEKLAREKQTQIEKAKAQKEKEERDRQKREANEAALLAKKAEKEKERLARIANGEPPPDNKKYIFIGAGVLALCLVIWWVSTLGDGGDRKAWNTALNANDSISYANYITAFPEGKFIGIAKENINLLYWERKKMQDSLALVSTLPTVIDDTKKSLDVSSDNTTTAPQESKATPENSTTPPSAAKPKSPPASKPKSSPATKPKPSPTPNTKKSLGMEYGGGIIVYINPEGTHGMIVSSKEVTDINWDKAKTVVDSYNKGSYSGWTMPSKNELNIIYLNRKYLGPSSGATYWSSTEENKNNVWTQNFANGNQVKTNKQSNAALRAVRAF